MSVMFKTVKGMSFLDNSRGDNTINIKSRGISRSLWLYSKNRVNKRLTKSVSEQARWLTTVSKLA